MYELLDKKSAIKEIQRFLRVISDRVNPNIPRVSIDGIYGQETFEAVSVFQEIYGLAKTGTVDRETFELLYLLHDSAIREKNTSNYIITNEGFPLKLGSQGNDVINLHLYITELEKTYADIGSVGKGSYFNTQTQNAVINLEKIFNMKASGEVSAILYQRILTELDAIRRLEEIYT